MTNILKASLMTAVMVGTLGYTSQFATAGMFYSDDFSTEQLATIKITMTDAIAQAKATQSGTVTRAKLEEEDGKLVYEIRLLDDGKEMTVMVDAVSGDVTTGRE